VKAGERFVAGRALPVDLPHWKEKNEEEKGC